MNQEYDKYTCSRCFLEIREEDGEILVLRNTLKNSMIDLCKFCREEFEKWMRQYIGKDTRERKFEVDVRRLDYLQKDKNKIKSI